MSFYYFDNYSEPFYINLGNGVLHVDEALTTEQVRTLKRAWEGTVTDVDQPTFDAICDEIEAERNRQNEKFPGQWGKQPPKSALSILTEEVGEVAKAINEDDDGLRAELVQVAAVAVAWIESLDAEAETASDEDAEIDWPRFGLTLTFNPDDEICGTCGKSRRKCPYPDISGLSGFRPTGRYAPPAPKPDPLDEICDICPKTHREHIEWAGRYGSPDGFQPSGRYAEAEAK